MSLLKADGLEKSFGALKAVDGVSFEISANETLGLVGESGSGKSTLAKCLLRLTDTDAGSLHFEGADITRGSGPALKAFRRGVQIIFQEPHASLDPRMPVGELLAEPLRLTGVKERVAIEEKVQKLLASVELPAGTASRHPRHLSGGEAQRVAIARALAVEPRLIVCDEIVASLDVIVRAQILNLLLKLQQEKGVSYLFISHDLRVVRHLSDRVLVMKDGRIVESGPRDHIFQAPQHEYTRLLVQTACNY